MVYSDGLPPVDYAGDSIYACAETYPAQAGHYGRIVQNCLKVGVNRNASALDVGAALGGLMQAFKDAGVEDVHGISLSASEAEVCRDRGLDVQVWNIEEAPWQQFDLVTVSHVLEHVPDIHGFLRNLYRWVKPGGRLYVEVPDATLYAERFTSLCQGFNSEHVNHFDHNHLGESLLRSGFHLRDYGHYIFDGYPCVYAISEPRWFNPNLRTKIEKYRDKLVPQIERVTERLKRDLDGVGSFSIWGVGETTKMLLKSGIIDRSQVIEGVDTNTVYHNRTVGGVSIVSPKDFNPAPDVPILVCSQLHAADIIAKIREMGLTNRIITLENE
jgi:SAM-dependent methyltransferase